MNKGMYIITIAAGLCFIVLSILRLTSTINLTGKWMLCFAIAGTLLVVADLINFMFNQYVKNNNKPVYFFFISVECIFIAAAVFSIFVLPHIDLNIKVKAVNKLGDALTLFGLGCAFISLTLKSLKTDKVKIPQD